MKVHVQCLLRPICLYILGSDCITVLITCIDRYMVIEQSASFSATLYNTHDNVHTQVNAKVLSIVGQVKQVHNVADVCIIIHVHR